jgi:short subunit dehydrogenase-like uncharacterized protein
MIIYKEYEVILFYMGKKTWLLYGAYGYTGRLIAQQAKDRAHEPVLAGRSADKLIPLAQELDLDYRVFDLKNEETIIKAIKEFDLVLHAAGPFKYTSSPMIKACLKSKTNYLDITGEIPVLEQNITYDAQAKKDDFVIISGVGFDVVPTDCLAKYVSDKIASPTSLEIGISSMSNLSPGTLKTMLEYNETGRLVRRNGKLVPLENEHGRKIQFIDKELIVKPVTWGDLSTAFRTTGIPNITIYFPVPGKSSNILKSIGVTGKELNSNEEAKKKVEDWIEEHIHGPNETARQTNRCQVWVSVSDNNGTSEQAWLETMESYRFTAVAAVRSVEKVFDLQPKGALTPALAFGKNFILEFPETIRYDSLN